MLRIVNCMEARSVRANIFLIKQNLKGKLQYGTGILLKPKWINIKVQF